MADREFGWLVIDQFFKRVEPVESGCWRWTGYKAKGHGRVRIPALCKVVPAHRFIYEVMIAPLSPDLEAHHVCGHRWCVNPTHVEPMTKADHARLAPTPAMANALKTHCLNGHEFTEANTLVRADGERECRACRRLRQNAHPRDRREYDRQRRLAGVRR